MDGYKIFKNSETFRMKIVKSFSIFILLFYNFLCFAQEEPKKIVLRVSKHKDFHRIVLNCEEEKVRDLLKVLPQKDNKIKISFPEDFNIEFQNKILTEGEITKEFYIKKFDNSYVITTPQFTEYKIYKLNSPYRFVIDIFTNQTIPSENVERQFSFLVILDAGHGGKDFGIIYQNLIEKDLTLSLAKELRSRLIQRGIKSILTRDSDIELSVRDRLKFLHNQKAGIFLSIHLSNDESFKLYCDYKKDKFLEKLSILLKNKISKNYTDQILIEQIPVYGLRNPDLKLLLIEIPKKTLFNDKQHLNKLIDSIVESILESTKFKN